MRPIGVMHFKVKNPKTDKKYSVEFVVVPDRLTPLIVAHTAQQMGLTDNCAYR